jgi:hypothetical protein
MWGRDVEEEAGRRDVGEADDAEEETRCCGRRSKRSGRRST